MSKPRRPEPRSPSVSATPLVGLGSLEEVAARFQSLLRPVHLQNAGKPIVGVDAHGAFTDPAGFGPGARPVVVDANWLRNDVLRACRNQGQTVMLTTANQGLVRLYCAPHILDEVDEHHAKWAEREQVSPADFLSCWRRKYLPLLRVVDPPRGLLSAAEAARIQALQDKDPDDLPSATLALLLQAPFISADVAAVRAVYGPGVTSRGLTELELLQLAGDTGQLREGFNAAALIPAVAGYALARGIVTAVKSAPVLAGPAALLAALGGLRIPRETWQRAGRAVTYAAEIAALATAVDTQWQARLLAAAPPAPGWNELAPQLRPTSVLARAVMHTLAQHPRSQLTMADLVAALPPLPVAQSDRPVRRVLRAHPGSFNNVRRGRWQLGHHTDTRTGSSRALA